MRTEEGISLAFRAIISMGRCLFSMALGTDRHGSKQTARAPSGSQRQSPCTGPVLVSRVSMMMRLQISASRDWLPLSAAGPGPGG